MRKKVVVLGGTGMLGAMVTDVFARESDLDVMTSVRAEGLGAFAHLPVGVRRLDAWAATVDDCRAAIGGAGWVVNCIGITKPLIAEDDAFKVERAIRVNAQFPHALATAAAAEGARVIQIATDCVFSGAHGNYREDSTHDALDVYGKTKSLGDHRAGAQGAQVSARLVSRPAACGDRQWLHQSRVERRDNAAFRACGPRHRTVWYCTPEAASPGPRRPNYQS
jgi:dTDP-4-dehydrorhamnose reductase